MIIERLTMKKGRSQCSRSDTWLAKILYKNMICRWINTHCVERVEYREKLDKLIIHSLFHCNLHRRMRKRKSLLNKLAFSMVAEKYAGSGSIWNLYIRFRSDVGTISFQGKSISSCRNNVRIYNLCGQMNEARIWEGFRCPATNFCGGIRSQNLKHSVRLTLERFWNSHNCWLAVL